MSKKEELPENAFKEENRSPFAGEGVDQNIRLANGDRKKELVLHLKSVIKGGYHGCRIFEKVRCT